jgi:integrase
LSPPPPWTGSRSPRPVTSSWYSSRQGCGAATPAAWHSAPTLDDSAGWPCLPFEATKVRAEQLIPLSATAAAAIRSQQEHVLQNWPAGSPWLFPGITGNDDGTKAYSHRTFAQQLAHWQQIIGLRDQAGQPVTVTGHQFRHTLGTRLINSGVPQHVVQKLLGTPART